MPASTRPRAVGAVIAVYLVATTATTALATPAQAATPLITVAMTSSGHPTPHYEIKVRNNTNGMAKATVRQSLPPGTSPAMISQGGQAIAAGQPGQAGTEVVWQVQLGARGTALLSTLLVPPPGGTKVTAPACAFVANGLMPYDCASATWDPAHAAAAGGSGPDNSVRAEPLASPPWWRRTTVLGTTLAVLVLLAAAGGVFWWRRRRRRRAAGSVNATGPTGSANATGPTGSVNATGPSGAEKRAEKRAAKRAEKRAAKKRAAEQRAAENRAAAAGRVVRRSGNPIARARARVRGDAKIPVPASVRRATDHPRIGGAAEHAELAGHAERTELAGRTEYPGRAEYPGQIEGAGRADGRQPTGNAKPVGVGVPTGRDDLLPHGRPVEDDRLLADDGLLGDDGLFRDDEQPRDDEPDDDGVLRDDDVVPRDESVEEGGQVGIAGGARYVGRAVIPPRRPAPDAEREPTPEAGAETEPAGAELPAQQPEEVTPAVGRARPRPHPSTAYRPPRRRAKPPAWLAVGLALVLAVAFASITAWAGSSQVNAISTNRQPSSGAWVGRTVAGPVGTTLRESAFEFTVYRLACPPTGGCQAIVGVRNLTDRSQQWHGTLQRAYLPTGDWVGADVPATQTANGGKDPFAEPVPAGERMIMPLVFASTGPTPPTRIELRSAVFSAGVSVDVPH